MATALVANLYNPHEQSKEQIVESFVARHDIFRELYQGIKSSSTRAAAPQHYLIEGQRGMGKTTLLLRLNYEIENDPDIQKTCISVVLKEEAYYGIRRLYTLWKTVAQELAVKDHAFDGVHERMCDAYSQQKHPQFWERNYEKICFDLLAKALKDQRKHLILCIDNFGELLYNFTGQELYRLYKILHDSPAIRLVGASSIALDALVNDQNGFFYALFHKKRLEGVNKEETYDLLLELAKTYDQEERIHQLIAKQPGRIESLRILTGGVIRSMVLLFEIFTEQEEGDIFADLDTVLDRVTPLYKSRIDTLTPLQRDVVHAIALNWEAISAEEIADKTHLHQEEIEHVLHALEHVFLIERTVSKRMYLYRLRERFLNIWYLMRLSVGNGQSRVTWLLHFLENWYSTTELSQVAQKHIHSVSGGHCEPDSAFYMTEAFVRTGILNQDLEHRMIQVTQKFLHETNERLASKASMSDQELVKRGNVYYHQELYEHAVPLLTKVKHKDEHINFRIGYAYSKLQQYQEAIPYLSEAARCGHIDSMLQLGILYDYHLQDYYHAKRFYGMAVEKGHTDAMLNLGHLYYYTLKDYSSAKKYYLMAVKAGCERATVLRSGTLSLSYLKTYLLTALKGHSKDQKAYHIHDFPEAQRDYLKAMRRTAAEAMFQLGNLHAKELRNLDKAEKFYHNAADVGHVKAMLFLGDFYNYTRQEPKQAERYYRMAAKKGNLTALVSLGFLYHNELRAPKKAEKCYTLAAQRGEISAMNGLAWLYFEQKREKKSALEYARSTIKAERNIHTCHTAACICLWNNLFDDAFEIAEHFMHSSEAYKTLDKDILYYLMLLLAKEQYHQVILYFRKADVNLRERYTPFYYALLYFIGDPGFDKLPPELNEPVRDVIKKIKLLRLDYA